MILFKLDTKQLDSLIARMEHLNQRKTQVGIFGGKPHTSSHDDSTIAGIATVLHYGRLDGSIAPRPFMLDKTDTKVVRQGLSKSVKDIMAGTSPELALQKLGDQLAKIVKDRADNLTSPANAPSVIAQKGFDNPLVETHEMIDSIEGRVV